MDGYIDIEGRNEIKCADVLEQSGKSEEDRKHGEGDASEVMMIAVERRKQGTCERGVDGQKAMDCR